MVLPFHKVGDHLAPAEHYARATQLINEASVEKMQSGEDVTVNYLGAIAESLQGLLSQQMTSV